ncbi:MAG: GlxA family transcriptional regulator [Sulfitobacter sp.]
MGRREADFQSVDRFDPGLGGAQSQSAFEIYVSDGFSDVEVSSIIHVLRSANAILRRQLFSWRCVSDAPGFLRSDGGMILEAEALLDAVIPPATMIAVGGSGQNTGWMRRMRMMQRKVLPVVLLSQAATRYIQDANPQGSVTTHWRDAAQLLETGYYPALSTRLSEKSNGVITAAGGTATTELMIGLIAQFLTPAQVAELSNTLLLGTIRKSDAEQPSDISRNASLFDAQITHALRLMEDSISEPLPMQELADAVGISTRHLERAFKSVLGDTPAKFYKRLRTKRARAMIEETLLPLVDVAVATGFGSNNMLSKAVKEEYGVTPSKMRARKSVCLLNFG